MAQKSIQAWVRTLQRSSKATLMRISKNQYKVYSPNAVKASKIILAKRR
jgi:hypothetical protein